MKEITTFERLLGRFEKNTPGPGGLAVYRSTIPRSILVVQSNLALRNFLVITKQFLKVKSSLFQTFNQSTI